MEDRKERLRQKGELLQIKLAANEERRFREQYLAELPERLGTYLQGCPFVVSPELDEVIRWFFVSPHGVGCSMLEIVEGTYFTPESYVYREFSWPDQLLEAALTVSDQHDSDEAFFYPFDGPVYRVPFGWARQNLVALFHCKAHQAMSQRYCPERMGVVTTDFSAGLVLDNYSGKLPEDPNSDEIVYQLATWGFG